MSPGQPAPQPVGQPGSPLMQPAPLPPGSPPQPVVYVQPVPVVQPAPVAVPQAPAGAAQPTPAHHDEHHEDMEVRIYSHSNFFYWWPVWVTGYIMALLTYVGGQQVTIGDTTVLFHHSKNLGVVFTLTFFLVIIITNVTLRGTSSVVVIMGAAILILVLAYFHLWEDVLYALGLVAIYMNMGFYIFFSTLVFLVWAFSMFVYDRLSYWKVRPGQITHERVIGGAEKSYDTRGMVFEKHREDLFRHWVLGLGSGDLQLTTTGARRETVYVPNVLFINRKVDQIQRLIAMKPTEFTRPVE
jgi:hypothetical protein